MEMVYTIQFFIQFSIQLRKYSYTIDLAYEIYATTWFVVSREPRDFVCR